MVLEDSRVQSCTLESVTFSPSGIHPSQSEPEAPVMDGQAGTYPGENELVLVHLLGSAAKGVDAKMMGWNPSFLC